MRRRTVLLSVGGTLAASVAGCTSGSDDRVSPTPTPTDSSTPTPTSNKSPGPERQRTVALVDQDTVPATHQVSIDVEVLESAISTAQTARIRLTMTNDGPERAFKVAPDECNLFHRGGSDDPAGLWLYLPRETSYLDREGEQWVPDRPRSQPRTDKVTVCVPQVYESGRSVTTEYEIWDDYRVNGYLQPDTYRWEESVEIWEDPEARYDEPPTVRFTWGFSISVEKPD